MHAMTVKLHLSIIEVSDRITAVFMIGIFIMEAPYLNSCCIRQPQRVNSEHCKRLFIQNATATTALRRSRRNGLNKTK